LHYYPDIEVIKLPVSDGGEGLVDTMLFARNGKKITIPVKDPLWRTVDASYGILPDNIAVIEMAAASGLPLLSDEEKNPLSTTTYGTGELIADAMKKGCKQIILGLGGSATNDGGIGMAAALGIRFLHDGKEVPLCGIGLEEITEIDTSGLNPLLKQTKITIACDVVNPLYGEKGAAYIYARQKGASDDDIERLDKGLRNFASVIESEIGCSISQIPGMGAAGGMALCIIAFGNAEIHHGVDIVLDALNFDEQIKGCDLIISGEGRTDSQSAMGKVLSGIGKRAAKQNALLITISGALENGCEELFNTGVSAMFATCRHLLSLEDTLKNAKEDLQRAADNLFRLMKRLSL
jgi:glycerate kinase